MNWMAVLAVLLELFGPVLAEWLRKLLDDAAKEMPGRPADRPGAFLYADLEALFGRARRKVWWFQYRKVAAIRLAERMAMERADEIHAAAMGHPVTMTPLTLAELIELGAKQL